MNRKQRRKRIKLRKQKDKARIVLMRLQGRSPRRRRSNPTSFADSLNGVFREVYQDKIANLIPDGSLLINKY
jgi:hypothetical protein